MTGDAETPLPENDDPTTTDTAKKPSRIRRWIKGCCIVFAVSAAGFISLMILLAILDASGVIDLETTSTVSPTNTRVVRPTIERVPTRKPIPRPTIQRVPTQTQPSISQIQRWVEQMEIMTLWFLLNVEATQLCILVGDIDWDDYRNRLDTLERQLISIADDVSDNYLHRYSVSDVNRILSNGNSLMREIERKCGW